MEIIYKEWLCLTHPNVLSLWPCRKHLSYNLHTCVRDSAKNFIYVHTEEWLTSQNSVITLFYLLLPGVICTLFSQYGQGIAHYTFNVLHGINSKNVSNWVIIWILIATNEKQIWDWTRENYPEGKNRFFSFIGLCNDMGHPATSCQVAVSSSIKKVKRLAPLWKNQNCGTD